MRWCVTTGSSSAAVLAFAGSALAWSLAFAGSPDLACGPPGCPFCGSCAVRTPRDAEIVSSPLTIQLVTQFINSGLKEGRSVISWKHRDTADTPYPADPGLYHDIRPTGP